MSERLLICGVNWLGDAVMSMPAIQLLHQHCPATSITMAVKPVWRDLWRMHASVESVVEFPARTSQMLGAASRIRRAAFDRVVIFPNSFRSALVPFLSGISPRRGVSGQLRSFLLTDAVSRVAADPGRRHQAWEYIRLLGLEGQSDELPSPQLMVDTRAAERLLGEEKERPWIGVFPGAARGPSKRWPSERFAAVAAELARSHQCGVVVLGTSKEADLCASVAAQIGTEAVNLAGRTSLPELAAVLKACSVTVCNDSGGMHLAAAVGTPVVAVFGVTDPTVTGPLGNVHKVIRAEGANASRAIARDSEEAEAALRSIEIDHVLSAAQTVLEEQL